MKDGPTDLPQSAIDQPLGTRLLEKTIADTRSRPDLRDWMSPDADAWTRSFPGLEELKLTATRDTTLKVCIATEDIVGPVRNGGIGTTYSFLAKILAAEGFDVTILYLRGDYVEMETLDHWIDHYAKAGVKFVAVPDYYTNQKAAGNSDRWTAPMFNMFRYLQEHHFDAVHVSEWRGSGFLSLLAKRQGLAFENTQFVVKCSSPWLWNRLYGSHALRTIDDLDKGTAEQRSVELGDHIIGGSAHLLRWMASQGYQIAEGRTFVQPNIISTEVLDRIISGRALEPGTRMPVEEIVFFGRLEARKGLDIFCEAINLLISRGVTLPRKISFMGKPGSRLETRPDISCVEFIKEVSADWPCEVELLTEFQQEDALRYLLGGNRLAVMPSIIENSSLAVYEAVICRIPFVASNSGGSPELVQEEYQKDVLCDAHPLRIADSVQAALTNGAVVAEASFDNRENTATWIRYHHNLKKIISKEKKARAKAKAKLTEPKVSIIVPHRDDMEALKGTLQACEMLDYPNFDVWVVDDRSSSTEIRIEMPRVKSKLADRGWHYVEMPGVDYGLCCNAAAEQSDAELFFFTRPGNALKRDALKQFVAVQQTRGKDVLTSFALDYNSRSIPFGDDQALHLSMPLLGNPNHTLFEAGKQSWDLLVTAEAFNAVGGFTGDYRVLAAEKELYHALELNGFAGETLPIALYWRKTRDRDREARELYNQRASEIRPLRPFYRYGPLGFRNVLLYAFGLYQRVTNLEGQFDKMRTDRDQQRDAKHKRIAERDQLRIRVERLREDNARLRLSSTAGAPFIDAEPSQNQPGQQGFQRVETLFGSLSNPGETSPPDEQLDELREQLAQRKADIRILHEALKKERSQEKREKSMKMLEEKTEKLALRNRQLEAARMRAKELEDRLKARNQEFKEMRATMLGPQSAQDLRNKVERLRTRNEETERKLKKRNRQLDRARAAAAGPEVEAERDALADRVKLLERKLKERNIEVRAMRAARARPILQRVKSRILGKK